MTLINNNKIRIPIIILSVLVLVASTVVGMYFVQKDADALAYVDNVGLLHFPNLIDLGYTGLTGLPFLGLSSSPSVSHNSTTSEYGSFTIDGVDNSLLNNSLSYSFSSSANSSFYSNPTTGFDINANGNSSFSFIITWLDNYSLPSIYPSTLLYYGFSVKASTGPFYVPRTFPVSVSLNTSRGNFVFDEDMSVNPYSTVPNNFYGICADLTYGDLLYSMTVQISLPNLPLSLSEFRFYVSASPFYTYPLEFGNNVVSTGVLTDAYSDGYNSGLVEGTSLGFTDGQKVGYNDGYYAGLQVSSTGGWYDLFSSIFNAPLEALFGTVDPSSGVPSGGLFNLSIPIGNDVLNLRPFVIGILSCLLVILVIKIILRFI